MSGGVVSGCGLKRGKREREDREIEMKRERENNK